MLARPGIYSEVPVPAVDVRWPLVQNLRKRYKRVVTNVHVIRLRLLQAQFVIKQARLHFGLEGGYRQIPSAVCFVGLAGKRSYLRLAAYEAPGHLLDCHGSGDRTRFKYRSNSSPTPALACGTCRQFVLVPFLTRALEPSAWNIYGTNYGYHLRGSDGGRLRDIVWSIVPQEKLSMAFRPSSAPFIRESYVVPTRVFSRKCRSPAL